MYVGTPSQPDETLANIKIQASGHSGSFITEALLKTGKHSITAVTRADSESTFPDGVMVKRVDYAKPATLVEALRGQDALVITLSGHTPKETEAQLIKAAGEAGVSWILPNEWSPDTAHEALVRDVFVFKPKGAKPCIKRYEKTTFTKYHLLLQTPHERVLWNSGRAPSSPCQPGFGTNGAWLYQQPTGSILQIVPPHSLTTVKPKYARLHGHKYVQRIAASPFVLPAYHIKVGRAVAALLSLPIRAEDGNSKACLDNLRNQVVYINSFNVSQKDMFKSALRVTGTQENGWTINKEPSKDRYASGLKEMGEGKRIGFAKMMYTRVFYPDGCGDFESSKGTLNSLLGLPKEDMDAATKIAIERSKGPAWV